MNYISVHHLPLSPNITLYLVSNLFNSSTRHPRVNMLDAVSEHHKYSSALLLLLHCSLASFIPTRIHKHNLLPHTYFLQSVCVSGPQRSLHWIPTKMNTLLLVNTVSSTHQNQTDGKPSKAKYSLRTPPQHPRVQSIFLFPENASFWWILF